jgi:hypothetical protein
MLAVNTSNYRKSTLARPKIRQLNHIPRNQHILRLDVPVEDALLVDVHDRLQQQVHVVFYFLVGEVFALDQAFV